MFAAEDSKFRRVKILAREWGGLLAEAVFRVFGFSMVPMSGHTRSLSAVYLGRRPGYHRSAEIGIYHTGS